MSEDMIKYVSLVGANHWCIITGYRCTQYDPTAPAPNCRQKTCVECKTAIDYEALMKRWGIKY